MAGIYNLFSDAIYDLTNEIIHPIAEIQALKEFQNITQNLKSNGVLHSTTLQLECDHYLQSNHSFDIIDSTTNMKFNNLCHQGIEQLRIQEIIQGVPEMYRAKLNGDEHWYIDADRRTTMNTNDNRGFRGVLADATLQYPEAIKQCNFGIGIDTGIGEFFRAKVPPINPAEIAEAYARLAENVVCIQILSSAFFEAITVHHQMTMPMVLLPGD